MAHNHTSAQAGGWGLLIKQSGVRPLHTGILSCSAPEKLNYLEGQDGLRENLERRESHLRESHL